MTRIDRRRDIHAPQRQPLGGVVYPALIGVAVGALAAAAFGAAISGMVAGTGWAWPTFRTLVDWFADHPRNPAAAWHTDPRPGPAWLTYLATAMVAAGEVAAASAGWLWWRTRRLRRGPTHGGMATRTQLERRLSARAVAKSAPRLRPSLTDTRLRVSPDVAGCYIGTHRASGLDLYATHEDSKAVIAPVRMGKTGRQAVSDVVRAPGAALVTTTRFDLIELTATQRAERGPVWVFDPEGRTPWPTRLRWSPIAGCDNYDTALRRAIAICAARPLHDTKGSGYFGGQAEGVLAALLHAAALADSTVDDLRLWTNTKSRLPVEILDAHPKAAFGVGAELRSLLDNLNTTNDSSGTGGIYSTLALLLRPLASPATRDALTPRTGDPVLDIDQFIESGNGTLYLISKGRKTGAAPMVNALASEVLHCADVLSQLPDSDQIDASARGDLRLDPPLRACLDEVGNTAPIDELNSLMADSGGRGIQIYIYVQSFSQLRQRWGAEQATEIWDNASVKLVLGGLSKPTDLEDISRLLGERSIEHASVSSGYHHGQVTVSQRYQRAMTADEIRTLPDGQGILLYRNLPGALLNLPGWWESPLRGPVERGRRVVRRMISTAGYPSLTEQDDVEAFS